MNNPVELIKEISGVNPLKCMKCGKCSASCPSYNEMDIKPHQFVFQFACFFQNAFFFLHDGNDNNLCRCDSGRQNQTAVVTVNHDNRTDKTGGHTPGSLMYIF